MINYSQILSLNYIGSQWSMDGSEYSGLDWLDSTPKPTQEELDALWIPTQEVIAANIQTDKDNKVSVLAKLTALGLTISDITALGIK